MSFTHLGDARSEIMERIERKAAIHPPAPFLFPRRLASRGSITELGSFVRPHNIRPPFIYSPCASMQHIPDIACQNSMFPSFLGDMGAGGTRATRASNSRIFGLPNEGSRSPSPRPAGSKTVIKPVSTSPQKAILPESQRRLPHRPPPRKHLIGLSAEDRLKRKMARKRASRKLRKVLNSVKRYWKRAVKPIRIPRIFKKFFLSSERSRGSFRVEAPLFGKKIDIKSMKG